MAATEAQIEAIRRYVGGRHVAINGDCRGDSDGDPRTFRDVHLLDTALEKSPLAQDEVVFRGISRAYAKELERRGLSVGDRLVDKAFLSTSRSKAVARGFLGYETEGLLMRIRLPGGRNALDLSPYSPLPEEQEYLLPRETVLRVTGYDVDEDILDLEVE
jgi:hypothetical protein